MLLESTNPFAQEAAYALGGFVVLIALGVGLWSRKAGPTLEEREHTKAVENGLKQLKRVRPIYITQYPAVSDVWHEASRRLGEQVPMPRWRAFLVRLRGRVSGRSVRVLECSDADDQRLYLADIAGTKLAHRDRSELQEDALTVLRAIRTGDNPPATMSEWFFRDVSEGRVDFERSRDRAMGDCKLRLEENLKREKELNRRDLKRRLVYDDGFRYPPDVVDSKLKQLLGRDVREHQDGTLRYQRY